MITMTSSGIADKTSISLAISLMVTLTCPAPAQRRAFTDGSKPAHPASHAAAGEWQSLFDGKNLHGWKSSIFGADGPIRVVNASIQLGVGEPLTGVTYDGPNDLPRFDYELRLRARRVEGTDFFCGLTFPYGDSHCTLILGGWGGGLVGLSSLEGCDAAENETTRYESFRHNQWYDVRLQVKEGAITAWIDGKQRVICSVAGRSVSTRPEVARSRPLGIASFRTKAEIKHIAWRRLAAAEIAAQAADPDAALRVAPTMSKPSAVDRKFVE